MTDVLIIDSVRYTRVSEKKGSNEGGFFKAQDGTEYYIKYAELTAGTEDKQNNFKNEVLATHLYRLYGIQVAQAETFESTTDGKKYFGIKIKKMADLKTVYERFNIDRSTYKGYQLTVDPALDAPFKVFRDKFWVGFSLDCLLANWDVVGLEYDNLSVDANDNPVRLDTGGALYYRAQGAPKGILFGNSANEFFSYTGNSDVKNGPCQFFFQELYHSVPALVTAREVLNRVSDNDLRKCIAQWTPAQFAHELSIKLIERKKFLTHEIEKRLEALQPKTSLPAASIACVLSAQPVSAPLPSVMAQPAPCAAAAAISLPPVMSTPFSSASGAALASKNKALLKIHEITTKNGKFQVSFVDKYDARFLCELYHYIAPTEPYLEVTYDQLNAVYVVSMKTLALFQQAQANYSIYHDPVEKKLRRKIYEETERRVADLLVKNIRGITKTVLRIAKAEYKPHEGGDDTNPNREKAIERIQIQFKDRTEMDLFVAAVKIAQQVSKTTVLQRVGRTSTGGGADFYVECSDAILSEEYAQYLIETYTSLRQDTMRYEPHIEYMHEDQGSIFVLNTLKPTTCVNSFLDNIIHACYHVPPTKTDHAWKQYGEQKHPILSRIQHGGLRAARLAQHAEQCLDLLKHYKHPLVSKFCETNAFLLKIAALYLHAGRGLDNGPNLRQWREASAKQCEEYLRVHHFQEEDIRAVCEAIILYDEPSIQERNPYALILATSERIENTLNEGLFTFPHTIEDFLSRSAGLSKGNIAALGNQLVTVAAFVAQKQSDLPAAWGCINAQFSIEEKKRIEFSQEGCFSKTTQAYQEAINLAKPTYFAPEVSEPEMLLPQNLHRLERISSPEIQADNLKSDWTLHCQPRILKEAQRKLVNGEWSSLLTAQFINALVLPEKIERFLPEGQSLNLFHLYLMQHLPGLLSKEEQPICQALLSGVFAKLKQGGRNILIKPQYPLSLFFYPDTPQTTVDMDRKWDRVYQLLFDVVRPKASDDSAKIQMNVDGNIGFFDLDAYRLAAEQEWLSYLRELLLNLNEDFCYHIKLTDNRANIPGLPEHALPRVIKARQEGLNNAIAKIKRLLTINSNNPNNPKSIYSPIDKITITFDDRTPYAQTSDVKNAVMYVFNEQRDNTKSYKVVLGQVVAEEPAKIYGSMILERTYKTQEGALTMDTPEGVMLGASFDENTVQLKQLRREFEAANSEYYSGNHSRIKASLADKASKILTQKDIFQLVFNKLLGSAVIDALIAAYGNDHFVKVYGRWNLPFRSNDLIKRYAYICSPHLILNMTEVGGRNTCSSPFDLQVSSEPGGDTVRIPTWNCTYPMDKQPPDELREFLGKLPSFGMLPRYGKPMQHYSLVSMNLYPTGLEPISDYDRYQIKLPMNSDWAFNPAHINKFYECLITCITKKIADSLSTLTQHDIEGYNRSRTRMGIVETTMTLEIWENKLHGLLQDLKDAIQQHLTCQVTPGTLVSQSPASFFSQQPISSTAVPQAAAAASAFS